jgi:hypothetical protein
VSERTDTERLDWLAAKGDGWVCRESVIERGWRLHQTTRADKSPTPRQAIDAAMDAEAPKAAPSVPEVMTPDEIPLYFRNLDDAH